MLRMFVSDVPVTGARWSKSGRLQAEATGIHSTANRNECWPTCRADDPRPRAKEGYGVIVGWIDDRLERFAIDEDATSATGSSSISALTGNADGIPQELVLIRDPVFGDDHIDRSVAMTPKQSRSRMSRRRVLQIMGAAGRLPPAGAPARGRADPGAR